MNQWLQCGRRRIDLSAPRVMGIINITPDSFSDGGHLFRDGAPALDRITRIAERMCRDGAAMVDVGGESTRPGAELVGEQQELDRVLPAVEAIASRIDVTISVDTSSARVIREAQRYGAGLINDVRALRRNGALAAVADTGLPVCLMHMHGEPATMQRAPTYDDVTAEVSSFLLQRAAACRAAGIPGERVLLDPGFGFGKTLAHNLELFRNLTSIVGLGHAVVIGVSRKSMIGQVLGRTVRRRTAGGLALAMLAASAGAKIIRTHDVRATQDALAMFAAVRDNRSV